MNFVARALFVLALSLAAGCRSTAGDARTNDFVFVYVKRGPSTIQRTDAERAEIQRGHMANIQRLANEGALVIAGPYGDPRRSQDYRGIFVFDVEDLAEAHALAASDPGVRAGVFAMEAHPIEASSTLRDLAALEAGLRAEIVRAGQTPDFTNTIRAYVIVETQDEAAVRKALGSQRVLFAARMSGAKLGTTLLVVDALDAATLHAQMASVDARLATNTFCESWWSSKSLERLPEAAALRASAPRR